MSRWLNHQVTNRGIRSNDERLWHDFIRAFQLRFTNTLLREQAQAKLKLGIPWEKGNIDKYVTEFEQTAREAGFNLDSLQTIDSFTDGIPKKLYEAAFQYDSPQTFEQWKREIGRASCRERVSPYV